MKKRTFLAVFAVLLTITLVAGACGPAEPPDEPTASPDEPEGPVTVDLWFHSGRSEERDALLSSFDEEFEAEYPNINIELVELPEGSYNDQVQSAAVAGELPCVLDFDGPFVYNYVWGDFLIPLEGYFSQEELDDFLPSIIAQGTYQDGHLYSLGQYDSGLAIWAQGPVLEAAGVRIPTVDDPWSREEFEDAMAAVLEVEGIEYALDMKMNYAPSAPSEWLTYGFSPILQSFGADLIDRSDYTTAEGVLNGRAAIEAMTMVQNWFNAGYANPNPADDACFTSGACAMSWVGHWTANAHIEAYGDDLLLLPVPNFGSGPKTGMGSWNWGITSQCANPDAAATVLRYLVSSESILAMTELNGAVPARFSALEQNELYAEGSLLSLYTDQIAAGYAVPRPITPAYPTITAAFSTAFRNIANGADVQDELDNAVDTIDADLEENGYYGGVTGEEATREEVAVIDVWFHSGRSEERDALLSSFDEEFEAEYPDIMLNLVELPEGTYNDQVQAAAIAGELPCVLDFDGPFVYNYVWGGFLIPIDEYFTEEELDDFLPSIIAQGTYQDGQLYSLGQYDSGLAIWAQGPVLEAAGVRIPTVDDPWSREEFEDAMAAVLEVEGIEYALDMKMNYAPSAPSEWLTYGFSPILQSFGADLIDRETYQTAEGVLNGPEAVEAMSMIQSWFENGYANPNPADDACFTSGACAMSWVGHWTANAHIEAYGDDLLLLPVPDFGNGAKTGMGSWNWGITSQCANPDAAATVLRYLVSSESILAMTELNGAVPARFSAMDQNELYAEGGLLSLYTDQIAAGYAVPRPITAAYPTITAAFSTAFRNIANGADVQDELDNAVDTIDADLEDNDFYQ